MGKKVDKMTNADYHATPAIGSTTLKLALESMAKLKAKEDGLLPFKTSTSMDIGSAAHAAILEQDFAMYVCGPDVDKRTKPWKEFVAQNEGKIHLKPMEYDNIKNMFDVFFNHGLASKLLQNGHPEISFFTEFQGQEYKARPDFLVESHSKGAYIVDYKTARSCRREDFQKSILNFGYDTQAAHYLAVVGEAIGKPIEDYFWIVQETEAPYELAIYRADRDLLDRASHKCKGCYARIAMSRKTGVYPGRELDRIVDIDLPAWAISKEENSD